MTDIQRKLKKLFIAGVVLSITVSVVWIAFKPEERVCFNGVRDFGEDGIDCGGICAKVCPPNLRPPQVSDIKVEWIKFVPDGKNNYDLVAKLLNNNENWGLSVLNYEFVVYNRQGVIIDSVKNQTFIMPKGFLKNKGKRYIIKNDFKTSENIEKIDLVLSNFNWNEVKDLRDLPELNAEIIKIRNKKYGFVDEKEDFYYASGITENISKHSFFYIDINVILFNENNEPIAVGKTDQWTLEANSGWQFEIRWKNPFFEDVDYADFDAQTNIFNMNNFMKERMTGEKYIIPR
ncbi:MAG: hypothetical protein U9N04_00165 [Patescibacteria group bacterium]|nr:hypothetical protein [Patescibacteria group bacterium]